MIFDKRLTWASPLRSLHPACQSPLDFLRHLSHTTWDADRTTLLRLYLVLVCYKLDYGADVCCTAFSRALCILNPSQDEVLPLATDAFRSSPIANLHVESNVLPLDLHRELLAMKALLRPYLFPFSPLQSLLASENLTSSSLKFALLLHP